MHDRRAKVTRPVESAQGARAGLKDSLNDLDDLERDTLEVGLRDF